MIHSFKTALVTGASSGIGKAVALLLAENGLKVVAVARNEEALQALASHPNILPLSCDVRNHQSIVEFVKAKQLEIDVLVNNAGLLTNRGAFTDITSQDIDDMVEVNLTSVLHLTHALLPEMAQRGRGHLFFTGSSAGLYPHPNSAVYGATKAAISMFCDNLRCDLLGTGVRVTEVAPGRVQTQLYRTAIGQEGAQQELYDGYESIHPEDLAELILHTLKQPLRVDVSKVAVFPTSQAPGGARIVKTV
ncbi:SDR family oxidoreductase [Leeia sp. TBRC 13508]|uniref:SDR family oxidoreductase n=1 Tax=Leeia speluncae TaxID=2884804 RepID=A0ABS8D8T8_9NEIS|nr:SDR family oxidoreductase [Leeia speluncae]MCB6184636.1 SDR family oxidoreductase [Leeia speluncae]